MFALSSLKQLLIQTLTSTIFFTLLLNCYITRANQIVETWFGNTFHISFIGNRFKLISSYYCKWMIQKWFFCIYFIYPYLCPLVHLLFLKMPHLILLCPPLGRDCPPSLLPSTPCRKPWGMNKYVRIKVSSLENY